MKVNKPIAGAAVVFTLGLSNIGALAVSNAGFAKSISRDTDCDKPCGRGSLQAKGHRDGCGIPDGCHWTTCSDHKYGCGFPEWDTGNDTCDNMHGCAD